MSLQFSYTHDLNVSPNNVAPQAYGKVIELTENEGILDLSKSLAQTKFCIWEDANARNIGGTPAKPLKTIDIFIIPGGNNAILEREDLVGLDWDSCFANVQFLPATDANKAANDDLARTGLYTHLKTLNNFCGIDLTTAIDV